jgi:hypothetical protein
MMQQNQNQIENQTPYAYSLKLETTAKGIRPHIHVYSNDENEVVTASRRIYEEIVAGLKEDRLPVAPMNGQIEEVKV